MILLLGSCYYDSIPCLRSQIGVLKESRETHLDKCQVMELGAKRPTMEAENTRKMVHRITHKMILRFSIPKLCE